MSNLDRHWRYKSLYWDYDKRKWQWLRKKQTKKGYCPVRGCRNACNLRWMPRAGKFLLKPQTYCARCSSRLDRVNHPLKYTYRRLRASAVRRKLSFDISYGEFYLYCQEHNYYSRSAKFCAETLTFDRIDPEKGYSIANIQIVTQSVNAKRNWAYQAQKRAEAETENSDEDPF